MVPLRRQQEAFESVYLKAQEGMRLPVSGGACKGLVLLSGRSNALLLLLLRQKDCSPGDQRDESSNRRASLLRSLCVVLCCSPVCEKQALFALFQAYKENNIEEQLIKKVHLQRHTGWNGL